MAISEQKRGNITYIVYGYRVDGKHYRIYCGKKGESSTNAKILGAKKQHYEAKLKHMQEMLK